MAMLFLRNRHWIGVWPETAAAAQMPATLLSGLAAAAAAWSVAAPARHGTAEQSLPLVVPRWRRELPGAAAVVAYFVAVSLLGQLVGVVVTARTAPPGFGLWPGYVVMALVVIVLAVAFGHAVGKVLSGRFAAAVAGLAWLIIAMYLGQLLDLSVLDGRVYDQINLLTITVRLLFAVVLLALAILLPPLNLRVGGHIPPGAGEPFALRRLGPAAVVSAATVVLLIAAAGLGSPIEARPEPAAALCQGTKVQVCLWPEHKKYEKDVAEITARIDRLPAFFTIPPRFDEYGLSYRSMSTDATVFYTDRGDRPPYFFILDGSIWSITGTMATEIVARSLTFCADEGASKGEQVDLRAVELQNWLEGYLVGGGQPDYRTNASSERQAAAARGHERANQGSAAVQFAWASELVKGFNSAPCH
ncbi:hypothetical protein ABZ807_18025 [Micromonospora sp. NPDC047548]|uniref:hypothetical protein n=1 Tax=Micromonospora sp. NPDC047548 TaxID=3155624 RepID=UPI00340C9CC9